MVSCVASGVVCGGGGALFSALSQFVCYGNCGGAVCISVDDIVCIGGADVAGDVCASGAVYVSGDAVNAGGAVDLVYVLDSPAAYLSRNYRIKWSTAAKVLLTLPCLSKIGGQE
jgi:hypothetical protein